MEAHVALAPRRSLLLIGSNEGFAFALEDTSKLYGYALINSFLVALLVMAVSMLPFVRCVCRGERGKKGLLNHPYPTKVNLEVRLD